MKDINIGFLRKFCNVISGFPMATGHFDKGIDHFHLTFRSPNMKWRLFNPKVMKKTLLFVIMVAITSSGFNQTPQSFSYQAILRNTNGTPLENQPVSLILSILDSQDQSYYVEVHNTETNDFGIVNVIVGKGITSDDLSEVDWSDGPYFLGVTVVNGESMGSSPILSVPYALLAESGNETMTFS